MKPAADRHAKDSGRRRRLPRSARWAIVVLVVVVLGILGYGAWLANAVRGDLVAAQDRARIVQAALAAGQRDRAQDFLDEVVDHSESARERTRDPLWRAGERVPFIGDDLIAVSEVTAAVADLARDGAVPLLEATDGLTPDTFVPVDGRIPLRPLRELNEPVTAVAPAFAAAVERIEGIQTDGLLGPVRSQLMRLDNEVLPTARGVVSAAQALPILPDMLGGSGPRQYLAVLQNNGETRATGGLPGVIMVIRVEAGRMELVRTTGPVEIGRQEEPALPLTAAEEALYDLQLGTFFQDTNFTPDFPRTAELMRAMWLDNAPEQVDGIVSLDPVGLSYLLGATGPVTLDDGTVLTAETVVDELLHETYQRLPDPVEQDTFFAEAGATLFSAFTRDVNDPAAFLGGMARASGEGRVYVHSFNDAEQEALAGSEVAGELPRDDGATPYVEVSVNDATGSKMSYFLDYRVGVEARSCADGRQELDATARFVSTAPRDMSGLSASVTGPGTFGTPVGSHLLLVRVHGPVGGTMGNFEVAGVPVEPAAIAVEHGRPAAVLSILLEPEELHVDVTWAMETGPGQTGDVEVGVTPGVQPNRKSSTAASACG
ncbi:MAG: DUF4012 domain-containing protein [Nocardioides sp.]|nr:DUF4012 domain-containing protein [Nocardioides sp.]